jgi:hypothetical protein
MTEKQIIYQEILRRTLPHIRNVATWSFWHRFKDKSVRHESQLIHNIWPSMFEPEFTEHDIWFLNWEVPAYIKNCSSKISPLYKETVQELEKLKSIVPEEMKTQLKEK